MCKNTVKKLPFVIICVPEQYMCVKVILENGGIIRFILSCYKN